MIYRAFVPFEKVGTNVAASTRALVIGNWKMNLDFVEAVHLGQQLGVIFKNRPVLHTDVVVMPPFVDIRSVASIVHSERIEFAVGAQHVSAFDNGAHTGEVSTSMLQRLGVEWVLVGHSERRAKYAMDDEVVNATLHAVLRAGLKPVLCVGEDSASREAGTHEALVREQLVRALEGLDSKYRDGLSVAYEPIWAIGTGATASTAQIQSMSTFIRSVVAQLQVVTIRVLYGGSVTSDNAAQLVVEAGVDGFLVGGASLKAESFVAIVQACDDCYAGKR